MSRLERITVETDAMGWRTTTMDVILNYGLLDAKPVQAYFRIKHWNDLTPELLNMMRKAIKETSSIWPEVTMNDPPMPEPALGVETHARIVE